jgi:integrase
MCAAIFTRIFHREAPPFSTGLNTLVALKRVLKTLALPGKLHTFRHTYISQALTRGVPEAVVRQWVGHVDPEILRLYTHVADEVSQAYVSRFSGKSQARDS